MTASTNPWTTAHRSKLSAVVHPNPKDPADFVPSADVAWGRTGFGPAPTSWTPELDAELLERAWNAATDVVTPLVDHLVATRGLEEALTVVARHRDPERQFLDFGWFRKHLYAADEATFTRARDWMLQGWESCEFGTRVRRAFTLSRDPSLARGLVDPMPELPHLSGELLIAVGDPALAARVLAASKGKVWSFAPAFDLVEAYGADAAPLLTAILERYEGKAAHRKPIEQALRLASSMGDASSSVPVVRAPAGPVLPEEAVYEGVYAVVAGHFSLPDDLIRVRLNARRVWNAAKTPTARTHAYFEGQGAKAELRAKAEKHGVPVFGQAELETLIASPLFHYRERITGTIREKLSSPTTNVTTWFVGDPATEAQLAAAEAAFGVPLDPALRALYAQCDGVQLRSDRARSKKQTLDPIRRSWGEVGSSYDGELGKGSSAVISLLPLADVLASRSFFGDPTDGRGRKVKLGRRQVDLERFLESAWLFDYWYDYYPVALWVDRENGEYRVVFGDDHGACWDDPNVTSVEAYLESLPLTCIDREHGKRRFQRNT
ncbi:MAG: hypothetical protein H6738_18790 [Alphaproteobacteria bacterium]|nr:hypothetical protein [Alphaproteobacteria bacterium]MCB9698835.1 hypothetical protein [Alphaproteobacteria bacterium]